MYSDMIEHAAAVLAAINCWPLRRASEYIEDLIFNTGMDIPGLLASIIDGTFEFLPPVRVRRAGKKGKRRDLWKAPGRIREAKVLGIPLKELEIIQQARDDVICRNHSYEEHRKAVKASEPFFRRVDTEQRRHYCRMNEFGIWGAGMKDLYYGFLTKQARREKHWKRVVKKYLSAESIRALKVH